MKLEDEIQSKFRSEYQKARLNIYFTNNFLAHQMNGLMKHHDVTPQQYNILRILRGQKGNVISVSLIKERMIDKNSDVSRIIERLVKKELIERKENELDRRQKDVKITKTGLDLLNKMDNCEQQMDEQLSHLNNEEATRLNELLDKIRDNNNQ